MDGPLDGIHVVDLTWNLPGPYASFLMASLGARITKVEPPRGDPARHMGTLFEMLNRNKDSVVVDLRTEAGKAELDTLIAGADVVLEGFRPGVADRLGCGADRVRDAHPRIVYCSISAYGQTGPRRDDPGHDLNVQALTGLCHLARDRHEHPHGLPIPVADLSAATNAVSSICAALYARERTQQGATLDVAMLDGALSWAHVWSEGVDLAASAEIPSGLGTVARHLLLNRLDRQRLHALPHYDLYRCRDGAWIALGIVDERHFWKALCAELGLGRLAAWSLPARAVLGPVLRRLVARRIRRHPRSHWLAKLTAAGVPVSPVLTPGEAVQDPHVASRLWGPQGLRAPLPGARSLTRSAPQLGRPAGATDVDES